MEEYLWLHPLSLTPSCHPPLLQMIPHCSRFLNLNLAWRTAVPLWGLDLFQVSVLLNFEEILRSQEAPDPKSLVQRFLSVQILTSFPAAAHRWTAMKKKIQVTIMKEILSKIFKCHLKILRQVCEAGLVKLFKATKTTT